VPWYDQLFRAGFESSLKNVFVFSFVMRVHMIIENVPVKDLTGKNFQVWTKANDRTGVPVS